MAYCHINIAHVYISTCGFHRPVDHSPLDFRFGWSPEILLPIKIAAVGILVMGQVLEIWALAVNRFHFLPTHTWRKTSAHDQHETGKIGPYRYIRHPNVAGTLLDSLCYPLIIGSLWMFIPMCIIIIIPLILMMVLEDRNLPGDLQGYREYANRGRYRLVPGVW